LKATITEKGSPAKAYVEIFWMSAQQWRRNLQSEEFSQTLIVNGDRVFEDDSDDYFPIGLQTLVTALIDPGPTLMAYQAGDVLYTKANGVSREDGMICPTGGRPGLCLGGGHGLREVVGSSIHSVEFMDYKNFQGKRIARTLFTSLGTGSNMKAEVTQLRKLKDPDSGLFAIAQATPNEKQFHVAVLPEPEFRSLILAGPEIIWPQVLDGAISGSARIYVSISPSGEVREAIPVHTDNERANESVCRQIKKWKFKPEVQNGIPVQAESILTFAMNTRAWGPPSPLSDAEVRKLATNMVEPVYPRNAHAGDTCTYRVAVDFEGRLIEAIAGEGTRALSQPCYEAISKWHFGPVLQNGEPRPYRGEIKFQVP